jgi:hypothetical protein
VDAVLGVAIIAVLLGAWYRYTWPVLRITAADASANPEMEKRVNSGMRANWVLALVALALGLLFHPSVIIFIFVPIATGAWMELVQKHEGAP